MLLLKHTMHIHDMVFTGHFGGLSRGSEASFATARVGTLGATWASGGRGSSALRTLAEDWIMVLVLNVLQLLRLVQQVVWVRWTTIYYDRVILLNLDTLKLPENRSNQLSWVPG